MSPSLSRVECVCVYPPHLPALGDFTLGSQSPMQGFVYLFFVCWPALLDRFSFCYSTCQSHSLSLACVSFPIFRLFMCSVLGDFSLLKVCVYSISMSFLSSPLAGHLSSPSPSRSCGCQIVLGGGG